MPRVQRYVSNELSHFVGRGRSAAAQFDVLVRILRSGWLTHPPHNPNVSGNLSINASARLSTNEMYAPEVVCFCDIPVEDLHIHTAKYSSFGLSFSKEVIAARGGGPVFYLPRGARLLELRSFSARQVVNVAQAEGPRLLEEEVSLGDLFDRMVPELHSMIERLGDLVMETRATPGVPDEQRRLYELLHFLNFRLFSYVKFFDESLEDDDPENFYMEREWRVLGNVRFDLGDVRRVIIPSSYAVRLRTDVPDFYGQVTFAD